jgi:hypothetical protein
LREGLRDPSRGIKGPIAVAVAVSGITLEWPIAAVEIHGVMHVGDGPGAYYERACVSG